MSDTPAVAAKLDQVRVDYSAAFTPVVEQPVATLLGNRSMLYYALYATGDRFLSNSIGRQLDTRHMKGNIDALIIAKAPKTQWPGGWMNAARLWQLSTSAFASNTDPGDAKVKGRFSADEIREAPLYRLCRMRVAKLDNAAGLVDLLDWLWDESVRGYAQLTVVDLEPMAVARQAMEERFGPRAILSDGTDASAVLQLAALILACVYLGWRASRRDKGAEVPIETDVNDPPTRLRLLNFMGVSNPSSPEGAAMGAHIYSLLVGSFDEQQHPLSAFLAAQPALTRLRSGHTLLSPERTVDRAIDPAFRGRFEKAARDWCAWEVLSAGVSHVLEEAAHQHLSRKLYMNLLENGSYIAMSYTRALRESV